MGGMALANPPNLEPHTSYLSQPCQGSQSSVNLVNQTNQAYYPLKLAENSWHSSYAPLGRIKVVEKLARPCQHQGLCGCLLLLSSSTEQSIPIRKEVVYFVYLAIKSFVLLILQIKLFVLLILRKNGGEGV
jgi:hypothetical protein